MPEKCHSSPVARVHVSSWVVKCVPKVGASIPDTIEPRMTETGVVVIKLLLNALVLHQSQLSSFRSPWMWYTTGIATEKR